MKLPSIKIRSKRKTLLIFFVALVLPLIIVTYLGFDTLTERHLTTKNILESNLWITGESALNQLEEELRTIEERLLNKEYLQQLYADSLPSEYHNYLSVFLLREDQSIAYPETGTAGNNRFSLSESAPSSYASTYIIAESQEFQHRNFPKAAEGYKRCLEVADSDREKAFALEGLGRTSLAQKNYSSASKYYELLHNEYSGIYNEVGHPYGIIGLLQLHEISKLRGNEGQLLPEFLDTYEKLRVGYWKLNSSAFSFFRSEIENALESQLLPEDDTLSMFSPYLADLELTAYLQKNVIRKIDGLQFLNSPGNDPQVQRIISQTDGDWSLISCLEFFNFLEGENVTGGIKWNTDSLWNYLIPTLLDKISTETGLRLLLWDESEATSHTSEIHENSISLSFRSFPLPWKIIVVQPAILNIEMEIRKEMLIYGLILGIMIILMILGAILITRDIRREADAMSMKTEFVHNVSHELKTPLSLIRLYGETLLIKESLSPAEKKDALQVITKESERLSHMINNILDFSRIEIGKKEFNFQKGDMAKTIQDTLDSYRYHLVKEGFTIRENVDQDLPQVSFDKDAIGRMMINLLSNAIKYSPEEKEISISLQSENAHVLLQVSDKGMGIASAELSHIFDRFYRSSEKTRSESSGSGLGLTLVKHIVDSHGGSIQVTSKPDEGSTFKLRFPITQSS